MKRTVYNTVESDCPVPVCYSGNKRIFHGIALSVLSLLKHTKRVVTVYILTMDLTSVNANFKAITQNQVNSLESVMKEYNPKNSVVLLDVSELFIKHFKDSKNMKSGYTPYAMLRLLLDMCDVPEKLVYTDVDVMFCDDVGKLYDIDVSGYEFAAVRDIVGHHWIRPSYCNSGVLILNFKAIKESGLFVKARKKVNKRKMFMPDQTALNFLAKRKLILPYKFNEQRDIKQDTVIKHFCKGFKWYGPFFRLYNYKQWHRDMVHEKLHIYCFDDIYALYDELDAKYNFNDD